MVKNVLIWNSDEEPIKGNHKLRMWRDTGSNTENSVSMSNLVEKNDILLRSRYLAWIYDLGISKIGNKTLSEKLSIAPGLSFWWMTLVSEKCNYAMSPHITDALKLMAFEMWMKDKSIDSVTFYGEDRQLAECLGLWCKDSNIPFVHHYKGSKSYFSVRKLYESLPYPLQALSYFCRYIYQRWCLRGVGLDRWKRSTGSLTFFSYLLNLNSAGIQVGHFESNYWSKLPEELGRRDIETNWLHQYVEHSMTPTPKEAGSLLEDFNNRGDSKQVHVMLESFLTVKILVIAILRWAKLIFRVRDAEVKLSAVTSGNVHLWALHKRDWRKSIYGSKGLMGIVTYLLMRSAIKQLPSQRLGIYLYEQQPWELALIHCWKTLGHGHLIGSQHSTMLFWDMRYYHDTRLYSCDGINSLPMPDNVAVNGPKAKQTCLDAGYPPQNVLELEALRYSGAKDVAKSPFRPNWSPGSPIRLLVLTDYQSEITKYHMALLQGATTMVKQEMSILVKPHPNYLVESKNFKGLSFKITMDPISHLLEQCDVVFCSSLTSAAIEVFSAGLPLVCSKDLNALNLSPLRDVDNVRFCSTSAQLATQIIESLKMGIEKNVGQQFFMIDEKSPRWIAEIERHLTENPI